MKFSFHLVLICFLGALSFPSFTRATTVVPPDFKTMVQRAEVIFRGKVTDVHSEWSGEGSQRCIITLVTFDVLKTLKGAPASPYVFKMLGGTVGDDAMQVSGAPQFAVGDHTLLFVEHNGTQFIPLVGIMHGYFRIKTDAKSGKDVVLKYNGNPLRNTAELDEDHARAVASSGTAAETAPANATPMQRTDFENEIQSRVTSGK